MKILNFYSKIKITKLPIGYLVILVICCVADENYAIG